MGDEYDEDEFETSPTHAGGGTTAPTSPTANAFDGDSAPTSPAGNAGGVDSAPTSPAGNAGGGVDTAPTSPAGDAGGASAPASPTTNAGAGAGSAPTSPAADAGGGGGGSGGSAPTSPAGNCGGSAPTSPAAAAEVPAAAEASDEPAEAVAPPPAPAAPPADGEPASAAASPKAAPPADAPASPTAEPAAAADTSPEAAEAAPAADNEAAGAGAEAADVGAAGNSPYSTQPPSAGPWASQGAHQSEHRPKLGAPRQVSSPLMASSSLTLAGLSASMGSMHSSKQPPHSALLSNVKTGPAFSMGTKTTSGGIFRSSSAPGPGSYNLQTNTGEKIGRYKAMPRYSFGGSSRFGLGENPMKEKPGPGHYGVPRDPGLERSARVSFGGGLRSDMAKKTDAPGPGAYELKSTVGDGKMFTAGGRHYGSTARSRMMPGPGAYEPSDRLDSKFKGSMKVGFGTSTREDFSSRREAGKPGPGTYEMQNKRGLGSEGAKFSIRSRRRHHDLSSYIEPGPGHYASHDTSFGGAGLDHLKTETSPKPIF